MVISGKAWEFVIVHGRQIWQGEEYLALIDPAPGGGGDIRITDTVPLGMQLELAAEAVLAIFREAAGLVPLLAGEGGPGLSRV